MSETKVRYVAMWENGRGESIERSFTSRDVCLVMVARVLAELPAGCSKVIETTWSDCSDPRVEFSISDLRP